MNNTPGYDLPNLKYIFADDIVIRLETIGYDNLCSDIIVIIYLKFIIALVIAIYSTGKIILLVI